MLIELFINCAVRNCISDGIIVILNYTVYGFLVNIIVSILQRSISLESNPTAMWDAWKTLLMEIVDKHAHLKQNGSQKNILRGLHTTWAELFKARLR